MTIYQLDFHYFIFNSKWSAVEETFASVKANESVGEEEGEKMTSALLKISAKYCLLLDRISHNKIIQREGTHQGEYGQSCDHRSRARRWCGFRLFRNITAWALLKVMIYFSTDTHTSKYCLCLVKSNLVIATCNYWSPEAEIIFGEISIGYLYESPTPLLPILE